MALSFSEAKNISIVEYLRGLGGERIRFEDMIIGITPFRVDNDPSFKVNTRMNVWYDHGFGEGGTLLDLDVKLYQCLYS